MPAERKLSPNVGALSPASSAPSLGPRRFDDLGTERPRLASDETPARGAPLPEDLAKERSPAKPYGRSYAAPTRARLTAPLRPPPGRERPQSTFGLVLGCASGV